MFKWIKKINRAIEYYATFFSIKCFSFDLEAMELGYDKIKERGHRKKRGYCI